MDEAITFLPRFARDGAIGFTCSDMGTWAMAFAGLFFGRPSSLRSGRIAFPISANRCRDPPFPRFSRFTNVLFAGFSERYHQRRIVGLEKLPFSWTFLVTPFALFCVVAARGEKVCEGISWTLKSNLPCDPPDGLAIFVFELTIFATGTLYVTMLEDNNLLTQIARAVHAAFHSPKTRNTVSPRLRAPPRLCRSDRIPPERK